MSGSKLLKRVLVTTAVVVSLFGTLNAAPKEKKYIIATASTGGLTILLELVLLRLQV